MRRDFPLWRRSKFLKTWAVITVVVAALSFLIVVCATESGANPSATPPPPNFFDRFKANTLSLAAILGALTGIFMFIGKVFKPFKRWFVSWARKSLEIVDATKAINERFESVESSIASNAQVSQKQYTVISGQNQYLEDAMSAVLKTLEEITRKLADSEDTNRALLRDSITKTYYKYNKRRAIPIHEKENMAKMYDTYDKLNGNSYVHGIMRVVGEWQVLSGEDASSNIIK